MWKVIIIIVFLLLTLCGLACALLNNKLQACYFLLLAILVYITNRRIIEDG